MTDASTDAPQETGALIDHILTRYHEMHRVDRASPVPLAARVERVHEDDPDAPRGPARALAALEQEVEDHRAKEEMILFPVMRAGGGRGIEHPIAVMRADHDDRAANIALAPCLGGDDACFRLGWGGAISTGRWACFLRAL